MISHHRFVTKTKGFTLLETIVYIGLFGIMFGGIFVSIYPIISGAERMTRNILIEGETLFILSKIKYALANTITSPDGEILIPAEGTTANALVLEYENDERYRFEIDNTPTFCTLPTLCKMLTQSINENSPLPLNAERVTIDDFVVKHNPPLPNGTPRSLEISFTINNKDIGPVLFYPHF